MANLNDDILGQISELQPSIWGLVANTVSENLNQQVACENPKVRLRTTGQIHADYTGPVLVVQFAMALLPESVQVVVIRPETVLDLVRLTTGLEAEEVDENILADVRPVAEAIVQGLCLSLGNIMVETIVATGLSIRNQPFQCPINMQRGKEVCFVSVDLVADGVKGDVAWIFDPETALTILRMPILDDDDPTATFASIPEGSTKVVNAPGGSTKIVGGPEVEAGSLEVLLDVPLEITVELGRVKMLVREVLDLGTGSIVEVDRAAGEPVDVMVNGRLVAKGEVVVIEDNFGVRITEILNASDRFKLDAAS